MGNHPITPPPHPPSKAVFLDRDGVINQVLLQAGKPYPPTSLAGLTLLPGVPEACQQLKAAGYLLILATNQPDVGRGTLAQSAVEAIHSHLQSILPLDRIEVCYDKGGDTPSQDRKPAPGMLLRAARILNIDLSQSFMVGDRWRDIDCGKAAGCTTLFIDYGYAEQLRATPDYTVKSLAEAARIILDRIPQLRVQ